MTPILQQLSNHAEINFSTLLNEFGSVLPLLHELHSTPHDPIWHAEGSVGVHTEMVFQEASKLAKQHSLSQTDTLKLRLGALLHDIGKPLVTKQQEQNGIMRVSSPRHACRGRSYLSLRLHELALPTDVHDTVLALVGHHHDPRKLINRNSSIHAYWKLARHCDLELLPLLCEADMRGRVCSDLDKQLEDIELFKLQCSEFKTEAAYDGWYDAIRNQFPTRSASFLQFALAESIRQLESGKINSLEEALATSYQLAEQPYRLSILCGLSGSGKSTWISQNQVDNTVVISLDQLREQLTGKRSNQSKNGQVMQLAKEQLKEGLRKKQNVIWDATNTRSDGRSLLSSLGFAYGAEVHIVQFHNKLKDIHARNRKRQHPIPSKALEHQIERFEAPYQYEAHDVTHVRHAQSNSEYSLPPPLHL